MGERRIVGKYVRGKKDEGKKPAEHHEDEGADAFFDNMSEQYPGVQFQWWFEADIELELAEPENEGIRKFWFEKEVITHDYLEILFSFQKKGWLHDRYIPELHAQGVIKNIVDQLCFNKSFEERAMVEVQKFGEAMSRIRSAVEGLIAKNDYDPAMNPSLTEVSQYLDRIARETIRVFRAIAVGHETYEMNVLGSMDVSGILDILSGWPKGNKLRQPLTNALTGLLKMRENDPGPAASGLQRVFGQSVRLILGDGGTGKTHGLARAVEDHLAGGAPAFIVKAKGTPCRNWDEIFRSGLQLNGWNLHEILAALESRAQLCDRRRIAKLLPGKELEDGSTKILVAVDGAEEDVRNWEQWYERIRECEVLTERYPRIRFIFSARSYFYNKAQLPGRPHYKAITLSREGDVPVQQVAANYFSHFKITGVGLNTIKGIGRLFGLRLFCDLYGPHDFKVGEEIITAEYALLNEKIRRVEEAFAQLLELSIGSTRTPIGDALDVVADCLSGGVEKVEHEDLAGKLKTGGIDYLPPGGVDWVIDHLVNHGFIVRLIEEEKLRGREVKKTYYSVSYEPIVELLIAARIVEDIRDGRRDRIPPHTTLPVVESVCQQLFEQDGRLIGIGGFLAEGLVGDSVLKLQLETLTKSPKAGNAEYVRLIEKQFLGGPQGRNLVMAHLILPASASGNMLFGADFLHSILSTQPSTFARDSIWVGPDSFDAPGKSRESAKLLGLPAAFRRLDASEYQLRPTALHHETPLVYAWALATLDQSFREKIRRALYLWAIKMPDEYLLLLEKMYKVNDPQIQEDMASIMLGLAGKLKDRSAILALAQWALKNVFGQVLQQRNVIIRLGFQSIVERAYQFGLIAEADVVQSRPGRRKVVELLPLDAGAVASQDDEIYPIVHDLSWYVLKDAFEEFLEYPKQDGNGKRDQDSREAKTLLDLYRAEYGTADLFAKAWIMAAALAYIRDSLGFDRTKGNGVTEASHGSKSNVFTFEEKYTWLAVHYLQGYLSDYVPLTSGDGIFLQSYLQIEYIPNPAENLTGGSETADEWWIPEALSNELNADNEVGKEIQQWIVEEPQVNWGRWLGADGADFPLLEDRKNWLVLYNWTALHDSSSAVYSALEATACLVKKGGQQEMLTLLQTDPDSLRFIDSLDRLKCRPDADTYTNPSDLVWMSWVGEEETGERYYWEEQERLLVYTVTRVMTNTVEGEKEITIPAKIIREMLHIVDLEGRLFYDRNNTCIAFRRDINEEQHDQQELVFVRADDMMTTLAEQGYEIVWLVDLWKRKNMSNEHLAHIPHVSRGRKYLVWKENGEYQAFKFWDAEHL